MIATSNGRNNNLDTLFSWKFYCCALHATARALAKFPFGKIVDFLSIRPNEFDICLTEKSVLECGKQCLHTTKSPFCEIYECCDKKNCASFLKRVAGYQTFLRTTSLVHTKKSPSHENDKYRGSVPEDSKVNGR